MTIKRKKKPHKKKAKFLDTVRYYTTIVSLFLLNLNVFGFSLKQICSPGFNCHGCSWATCACPIGVAAHGFSVRQIPYLAIGTILAIGSIAGRLVCAFVCPFGLFQDLIYRIPFMKLKMPSFLRYTKYLALLFLVVAFPLMYGLKHSGFMKVVPDPNTMSPEGVAVTIENLGDGMIHNPIVELSYTPNPPKNGETEAVTNLEEGVSAEQETPTTPEELVDGVWMGMDAKGFPTGRKEFKGISVEPHQKLKLPMIVFPKRIDEAVLDIKVYTVVNKNNIPLPEPKVQAYYCLVCPVGALTASLPKAISTAVGGDEDGGFYSAVFLEWKFAILLFFLILMLIFSRPFCQTFCPLGAVYGLCTPFSVSQMNLNKETCVNCGLCDQVCPMDLDVRREVGGAECIYCGNCMKICPKDSITRNFGFRSSVTAKTSNTR